MCTAQRTGERALEMRRMIVLLVAAAVAAASYHHHGFLRNRMIREKYAPWGREVSVEGCTSNTDMTNYSLLASTVCVGR